MTTGFGLSADTYAAVGVSVSGSATLSLFVISAVLCCLPLLFSLRKVPGDMVSGGTNSMVLAAACHVSTTARGKRAAKSFTSSTTERTGDGNVMRRYVDEEASLTLEYKPWHESSARDVVLERSRMDTGTRTPPRTEGPAAVLSEQQGNVGDGERLLPHSSTRNSEDYEKALLEEVATSHIKWGAVAASPEMLDGLVADEPVMHLGFGTEEDDVRPPQEGHLYI